MPTEKFLGTYSIRPLAENEEYYCQNGCGECKKVIKVENNFKVTASDGVVEERHYSHVEVSDCCKAEIGIWNTATDEDQEVEYTFKPANQ